MVQVEPPVPTTDQILTTLNPALHIPFAGMLGKIKKRFSSRNNSRGRNGSSADTDRATMELPAQHGSQDLQPTISASTRDSSTSQPVVEPQPVYPPTSPVRPPSPQTHVSTLTPHPSIDDSTPNVIIFGESGVGKSSVVNMIVGKEVAATSSAAVGCTFESNPSDAELSGKKYRLWDTIGLNEGERGTHSADVAYGYLHKLVQSLKDGGINLLVYCIRGSRIREIIKINYDLFHRIICNHNVPIVLVVTGLENEDEMEGWWRDNCIDFERRGMHFQDHACITSTKGKVGKDGKHMFEEEYNESVEVVRRLVVTRCPEASWKPDSQTWLGDIVETMERLYLRSATSPRDNNSQALQTAEQLPEWLRQFFLYIITTQQASQEGSS